MTRNEPDLRSEPARASLVGSEVSVLLGSGFDIWLHSYFLAGLVQLAKEGVIRLRAMQSSDTARCSEMSSSEYPVFVLKCTQSDTEKPVIVCFDPKDRSDIWQREALARCHVYFKRSAYPADVDRLPPALKSKVLPIAPMFAVWVRGASDWTARLFGFFIRSVWRQMASGVSANAAIRSMLHNVRTLSALSTLDRYEDTPAGNKRGQVLFQTRLWDPSEEEGPWVASCNDERVEMVRVMRARLGDRVIGGLVPSPYARHNYPDLLSNLTQTSKAGRSEFVRRCREYLIRVNIRALFDAVPYSLGETLAANNCAVSRIVRNSLATPLVEGRHYMGFATPRECADACVEILHSTREACALREESFEYYREAVAPARAMRMCLERAMASKPRGAL